MVPYQDDLNKAKECIAENLDQCESVIFFGVKNVREVIGVTAGNDYNHVNLLVSAAVLDPGLANMLIAVGDVLRARRMQEARISKN